MTEHTETAVESGSLERGLGSIVVGLVAAVLVIISLEPVLERFYPVAELNPLEAAEQVGPSTVSLPTLSFVLLLAAYALASLVGGLATALTSDRTKAWPSIVTGLILMIAGSYGVMAVSQPLWFRAASFLTYPMAYLGHLIVRKTS
jgi:hypothetical protein